MRKVYRLPGIPLGETDGRLRRRWFFGAGFDDRLTEAAEARLKELAADSAVVVFACELEDRRSLEVSPQTVTGFRQEALRCGR